MEGGEENMSNPGNQVVVRKDSNIFIEIDVAKKYKTGVRLICDNEVLVKEEYKDRTMQEYLLIMATVRSIKRFVADKLGFNDIEVRVV